LPTDRRQRGCWLSFPWSAVRLIVLRRLLADAPRRDYQNVARGAARDRLRHAADEQPREPAPAVRAHHQQIGPPFFRLRPDLGRRVAESNSALARHALRRPALEEGIEVALSNGLQE